MNLIEEWIKAKDEEVCAQDRRRELEDKMLSLFGIEESLEGVEKLEQDGYEVKITGRMNRKVDSGKVNELIVENGLEAFSSILFRWSADLNLTAWKATSKEITDKFASAITTKPGRPSFAVIKKEV